MTGRTAFPASLATTVIFDAAGLEEVLTTLQAMKYTVHDDRPPPSPLCRLCKTDHSDGRDREACRQKWFAEKRGAQ